MIRLLLRSNAVVDATLGVFLLAATWNGLYEAFGIPHPDIAIYAQIAGGFAVAFAYLLWIAPRHSALTHGVAAASAIAHALAATVGIVWLVEDGVAKPLLVVLVLVAGAYAAAAAWVASRRAAMLMPGD